MAKQDNWQVFVARGDSMGGRALRHQLSWEGWVYSLWEQREKAAPSEEAEEVWWRRGLLLPFAELTEENAGKYLPKIALALQQAREVDRVVLLLGEPVPEVLNLLKRHQDKGLSCTAVCAHKGQLYGWERPSEPVTVVEELLDAFEARVNSASPRKRLLLPYREEETKTLLYAGDLASAAIYALSRDEGLLPIMVGGASSTYGEIAAAAGAAAGFEGKIQFGRSRLKEAPPQSTEAFRVTQGLQPYGLQLTLPYLCRARRRKGSFTISACVIMRDNQEDIGRCLESLKQMDEIIVVDTGSVDKSVEIARQYTDKIYHFKWIDDFAAAKNFALEKAVGDWIVFLDSDEFFTEETRENVRQTALDYDGLLGAPRQLLVRRMELDKDLHVNGSEGPASRLFRRGARYLGAVHETLVMPDGQEILSMPVPRERLLIGHTGYDQARLLDKLERNAHILEKAHAEGHDIPLQHYNMSKILMLQGRYQEAREEILLSRKMEMPPASFRAEIYRIWYNASAALGDEKAMDEAAAAMRAEMPDMPDTYAIEGVRLWNDGREEEAAPLLKRALELSLTFTQLNPGESDAVRKDMPAVAQALIEHYEKKGEKEQAAEIKNILTSLQKLAYN